MVCVYSKGVVPLLVSRLSGFKAPVKIIVDSVALSMCVLDVFLFHVIVCGCVCWFLSHIIVRRWCVY